MPASPAEKTLRNVLFISGMDGWGIALFAGLCTLITVLGGEWFGVMIGAMITACGVLEIRGRGQLKAGDINGVKWLVRAQVFILAIILVYSFQNLLAYDETALLAEVTPEIREALYQLGISLEQIRPMMKPVYYSLYLTVIGVTLLYQGGLALYYQSRKDRLEDALAARPAMPPTLPVARAKPSVLPPKL